MIKHCLTPIISIIIQPRSRPVLTLPITIGPLCGKQKKKNSPLKIWKISTDRIELSNYTQFYQEADQTS